MNRVCSCSSRACELMGCQADAEERRRFGMTNMWEFRPRPTVPIQSEGVTQGVQPLTEADVRRIVREEFARMAGK